MRTYDITLLTAHEYLHPSDPDWYVKQILHEDQLITAALEKKGFRVHRTDWTNRTFDWRQTKSVLFRAIWDYVHRYDEFLLFLNEISPHTQMINPFKTVLWNIDKHYLRDLKASGITIPQTIYIEKAGHITLRQLHEQHGLQETILKPVMSGGARHTYRLTDDTLDHHEPIFQQLISKEALMLQPFLHDVTVTGEITLVVIGGRYSHAVLKKAKPGDFRVQDDFGGTVHSYTPTEAEIEFAERTAAVCSPVPVYARVDLLRDQNGTLVVSELELIEPELWFRFHPPAADMLAETIMQSFHSVTLI